MNILAIYKKLENKLMGKRIFTYMVCKKIPYFFSIRPRILELKEGRSVVQMTERRAIQNHVNSIHAIAMCNLCELSMAMTVSATIPPQFKFIPVGIDACYKAKAKGTLTAISELKPTDFTPGELGVEVNVFDQSDVNVMSATVKVNIKER